MILAAACHLERSPRYQHSIRPDEATVYDAGIRVKYLDIIRVLMGAHEVELVLLIASGELSVFWRQTINCRQACI